MEEVAKLQQERPDDRFEIIPKPRTNPDEPLEWRLKCLGEFQARPPCMIDVY